MTDEVSSEVIKKTQKALGKYVKKPPLTDKLLKKPPFRFLHDVVHAVINETGFLKGLYSEEELVSDNVKEKDAKIAFLNKLIKAAQTLSQSNLSVRANKVVAGLEPTNTNLLLQAIAKSIDAKADSNQYVSQLKSDNKNDKNKKSNVPKTEKSKSVTRSSNKDEKISKVSKSTKATIVVETPKSKLDTPKSKLDTPKASKEKISSRKEDDKKHKIGRRGREEKKDTKESKKSPKESPKIEESPKTDSSKKEIKKNESVIRRNSYTVEPKSSGEKEVNKNEDKQNANAENNQVDSNEDFEIQKDTADKIVNNIATINKTLNLENNQNQKNEEVEEPTKNLVRPKSARPKTGEIKLSSALKEEKGIEPVSKRLEMDSSQPKHLITPSRPKSSLRPPSVRPSSARPGAPRLRADSALPLHEPIAMGNINVIVERIDTSAVDEEETVVIETAPAEPEVVPEAPVVLDNKGHLVEQILEQLEESGGRKRTEIDWEPDVAARTKEGSSKDVTLLASIIQNLTKTANPLGKLINYLHEDIEAMHSELQMWINTKKQLYTEIRKQKRSSVESNKPLLSHLESLNQDIKKIQLEITQINCNIIKNDTRIKELLCK